MRASFAQSSTTPNWSPMVACRFLCARNSLQLMSQERGCVVTVLVSSGGRPSTAMGTKVLNSRLQTENGQERTNWGVGRAVHQPLALCLPELRLIPEAPDMGTQSQCGHCSSSHQTTVCQTPSGDSQRSDSLLF